MAIMIDGLEMPKENERLDIVIHPNGKVCYCLDLKCKQIATAEPVKHGHWIDAQDTSGHHYQRCSECGTYIEDVFFANDYDANYCPNCGAKMDEVKNG